MDNRITFAVAVIHSKRDLADLKALNQGKVIFREGGKNRFISIAFLPLISKFANFACVFKHGQ